MHVSEEEMTGTAIGRGGAVTVLLSSAGRRGALVGALREGAELAGVSLRLLATDCSPLTSAGLLCDDLRLVPRIDSPDYLATMLELVEHEGPLVIVPTIDTELPMLAENRKLFLDVGSDVVVSDTETIEICGDKARSSNWLQSHGFPVPRQFAWNEVVTLASSAWPLFYKPRAGSSSIGAQRVASLSALADAVERFGDGVVEEVVEGNEFTVDCWVDVTGRCRAAVPRQRLAVRAGEVAKAVTVRDDVLEELAMAIAETLPAARGPVTVQVIVGRDGPQVIEINPRFGGGFPLTHQAGGRFTAALLAEVAGIGVDPDWFSWRAGLTMLRYDDAVFVESESLGAAGAQ